MTHFPFRIIRGRAGTGEVGPRHSPCQARCGSGSGSLPGRGRLAASEVSGEAADLPRAGDSLALVEDADDVRVPWTGGGVGRTGDPRLPFGAALRDAGATEELRSYGLRALDTSDGVRRLVRPGGSGADFIDVRRCRCRRRSRGGLGASHRVRGRIARRSSRCATLQPTPAIR